MSEALKPLFIVSDEYELLALWRLVAEAKFHPDPEDSDIWGSPFAHSLSRRIDDALFECAKSKGAGKAEMHLAWRTSLESNAVLPAVKKHLKNDAVSTQWKTWRMDKKIAHLRDCVAPFEVPFALAEQLILEAEG